MTLSTPDIAVTGNLVARPTTMDDLEAFYTLNDIAMHEEHGGNNETIDDIRASWSRPGYDLSRSSRSIYTADGQMVGYVNVWDVGETPVRPWTWGFVHPDYRGQGLGTALVQWAIERGRQAIDRVPENAQVTLMSHAISHDAARKQLLEDNGYVGGRQSLDMLIELDDAPPAPVWPEGITISNLAEQGDLMAVYVAIEDAFKDHRHHVDRPLEEGFERFKHWLDNESKFTPELCYLAMDGETIAGVSLCFSERWDDPAKGYVETLGVRRAYRRKGLGLALLHYSFGEMWNLGQRKVALEVDGSSITGATRLYERAGMHVDVAYDMYELVLRAGEELSNQG